MSAAVLQHERLPHWHPRVEHTLQQQQYYAFFRPQETPTSYAVLVLTSCESTGGDRSDPARPERDN